MEKYKTVLDFLGDSHPELISLLEDIKTEEKILKIQKVFLFLMGCGKDDGAADIFSALMCAIDDYELLPFVGEDGKFSIWGDELEAAKAKARKNRAAKAIDLFKIFDDDSTLYLPKTQETIIQEVISWWRDTKDEMEADKLFDFIVKSASVFYPGKEWRYFLKDIKTTTDLNFSRSRLLRHILILLSDKDGRMTYVEGAKADIFRIMMNGWLWLRSNTSKEIGLVLQASQPLFEEIEKNRGFAFSETIVSAFGVLHKRAEKMAALYRTAEVLRKDIENLSSGLRFSFHPPNEERPKRVLITITDSNLLSVRLGASPVLWNDDVVAFGEKFFSTAGDFLRKWLKKNHILCDFKCLVFKLVIENEFRIFYEEQGLISL